MSDYQPPAPPPPPPATVPVALPPERVGLGLLFSLPAIPAGVVVAVILWQLGFIAGISSFVIAAGAVYLYSRGAGRSPRLGLAPLLLLIVLGIVISFFATAASDLWKYYDDFGIGTTGQGRLSFIADNVFDSEFLKADYAGRDVVFFVIFAVLGVFSTLRRSFAAR